MKEKKQMEERIMKPTIDKMFSELRKHMSYRLKRFTMSQNRLMGEKSHHIFICMLVAYSEFLR